VRCSPESSQGKILGGKKGDLASASASQKHWGNCDRNPTQT
jgi:hypothetical protein